MQHFIVVFSFFNHGMHDCKAPNTTLWQTKSKPQQWWHWIAWWRDTSTALVMFLWLNFWPQ